MREVNGWIIESYETYRRSQGVKLITLNNELTTLKKFFEYLARIEVISDEIPDKIDIPEVPPEEQSDDTKLTEEAALNLIRYYRNSEENGTRSHVLLELIWHTGARSGGIRSLDLRDLCETNEGVRFLNFVNRPETGTRLKKGVNGERPVTLNEDVWDAIDAYVAKGRVDKYDEHGRQPLITSNQGRPAGSSIRDWTYLATVPCKHSKCPHDKDPETCEYNAYKSAGGCPSSRSPHHVITGAITWMLNRGIPAEVVAQRTNKSVETIEKHYDKEDQVREMVKRRYPHFGTIDITDETQNNES